MRTTRLQPLAIDLFVQLAHDSPGTAMAQLSGCRSLARAASSWGETALQAASHLGHRALIACLLESGADLDVFAAAAMADREAVRSMTAGRDRDLLGVHDLPLLHFAVMSRDLAMVEALLAAGAAHSSPAASLSPLHSAVGIGSTSMVRVLVSAGADVAFTDAFGETALDWAYDLRVSDPEMLELLGATRARAARRSA
jgi:ankyrin repeat protein